MNGDDSVSRRQAFSSLAGGVFALGGAPAARPSVVVIV
jgi:hypothetical protein